MAVKKVTEVKLPHSRDTKGTHLFASTDKTLAITNVYVSKGTFPNDQAPDEIIVTISA